MSKYLSGLDLLVECARDDISVGEAHQGTRPIVEQEGVLEEFADAARLGVTGGYRVVSCDRETVPYIELYNPLDD